MGASRNIAFIIVLLLIIPVSLGITDSAQKGQTKSYQINNHNYEVKCVNGNSDTQIADYSINGQAFGLLQGASTWTLAGEVILRNLGFISGLCQFAIGLESDPAMCNECATEHERWCGHSGYMDGDKNRIWSCENFNGCLQVSNYGYCNSPQVCSNAECITPSGCLSNNPPCDSGYECINNQCVKKCNEQNICEGNYVYHQTTDCNKQQIKFCQWGCFNGDCSGAPSGCAYNNPTCPTNYNCVNNQCIEQKPTGCAYNNPPCSSGYTCTNNQCVQSQQACNPECNNLQQKWCNGNVAMGCYKVNNCLKGLQIEICSSSKTCINGKCVPQQELGCAYHNSDCPSGEECINNQCLPKKSTCIPGWKCKDGFTPGYQNIYCIWSNLANCPHGCEDGHCKQSSINIQKASEHPILFVHGHSVLSGTKTADENLDNVKDIRDKLVLDYGTFYGVQAIHQGILNEKDVERWCTETEQCLKKDSCLINNRKSQRIIGFSYYYGSDIFHTNESKSITEYSDDLNKAINLIYQCTNSKINIITSSMGGLVSREYLRKYGDSKVHKLIMLGTPNKGISGAVGDNCERTIFAIPVHPGPECQDMKNDSEFIKNLNAYKSDKVIYVTIAGNYSKPFFNGLIPCLNQKNGDCAVDVSSALLDYAYQYIVDCYHEDLRTNKCPIVYSYIKEVLEDDYSHALKSATGTNLNQESTNIQPSVNSVQQNPIPATDSNIHPSTQKLQKQQSTLIEKSNSQVKSTNEKPKETHHEPEKQEQKREEPKNLVLVIKSWFSKWFG